MISVEEFGTYDVGKPDGGEILGFEKHTVHTTAGMRISGSPQEVDIVLNALENSGFSFKSNRKLYPCRDNPRRFNLYLNFLKCPTLFQVVSHNS